jgi:hypothetical protein
MKDDGIRWFRAVFTALGGLYVLMAASALARGVGMLRDFGVPDEAVRSPVLGDFFSCFYELMAFVGVLMVLFGHVTRGRRAQAQVAAVFAVSKFLFALRDLSTSDSRFGDRLYKGEATLVFVIIGVAYALVFAAVAVAGFVGARREPTNERSASQTPDP